MLIHYDIECNIYTTFAYSFNTTDYTDYTNSFPCASINFVHHFTDSRAVVTLRDRNHQSSIVIHHIFTTDYTDFTDYMYSVICEMRNKIQGKKSV